jgi:hypothetical protein
LFSQASLKKAPAAKAAGAFSKGNPLIDFFQKINERVSFFILPRKAA